MGLLAQAQDWLNRTLQTAGGVSVVYVRGVQSLPLTAVVGRTAFAQVGGQNAAGAAVIWGDRDYLITAADLTLGEPRRGDRITETIDGVACVFECMAPGNEPAWRWSDAGRTKYRIHTKQVS